MRISREADYATRIIYHLSHLGPHQRATAKSIAKTQKIPLSFLAKIIKRLALAGLINIYRGAQGGSSLARQPSDISVRDVVEAIEGPIVMHECDADLEDCEFSEDCPLHPFWCEAQALLVDQLQNTTFDQFGLDASEAKTSSIS